MKSTGTYARHCERRVWYVAYGSNLSRERFHCYLRGGTPAGGSRAYQGCADPSEPVADIPIDIRNAMYFAGTSTVWGGSMAFVETTDGAADATLGRAYLITERQFQSVFAQENRLDEASVDLVRLRAGESLGGNYGRALWLGQREGFPLVTFTAPRRATASSGAPSPAYLQTIAGGLREAHGLEIDAILDYLVAKPGIAGALSRGALEEFLGETASL